MAIFDPPWAVDGEIYVPTEAEIREGFDCGGANPFLFNYLFQRVEFAINGLDTEGMTPLSRVFATTEGIRGGGDFTTNRTFRLDFDGLEVQTTVQNSDLLAFFRDGQHYKITRANLMAGLGEGGELTGADNIGIGTGEMFSALDGNTILFRTLYAGDGLEITTGVSEVTIAFADLPVEDTIE